MQRRSKLGAVVAALLAAAVAASTASAAPARMVSVLCPIHPNDTIIWWEQFKPVTAEIVWQESTGSITRRILEVEKGASMITTITPSVDFLRTLEVFVTLTSKSGRTIETSALCL